MVLVPPGFLGEIHGGIRVLEQRFPVGAIVGIYADPDAGGEIEFPPLHVNGHPHGAGHLFRDGRDRIQFADIGKHHHELVAARPAQGVFLTNAVPQALGHVAQHFIADIVPQRIVDDLEAIHVNRKHDHKLPSSLRLRQRRADPVEQQRPVGQPRERIVVDQILNPLLGGLPLPVIGEGRHIM